MVSDKEKYEALSCILKSKAFAKSTTANNLLRFLVKSTIERKEVSATTIGIELFGSKYDSEKSDVNIRVNISHLRKRLKLYYETEGLNDKLIISIDVGQYKVSFDYPKSINNRFKVRVGVGGFFAVILLVLFLLVDKRKESVWNHLLSNKLETTLYLGDVFGYSGPTIFGTKGWHRDSRINSADDFYAEVKKNPQKYEQLEVGSFSYVVFENSYNIKPFTHFFTKNNYNFSIRPTSGFQTRSIKDQNLIYAGPLFVKNDFVDLFNNLSRSVNLEVDQEVSWSYLFKYNDTDNHEKVINLNAGGGTTGEYAIASAFNGPNNTRHHMFFSNHGMGLNAVVEYFTNPDSLCAFSTRYLNKDDEFVALYYVRGKDRTNLSMDLVYIGGS